MKGNQKVMDEYVAKDFGKLLKRNALQMRRIMLASNTDVMRVYDRNLTDIQVTVDFYGQYARITDYSDTPITEQDIDEICDVVSRMVYIEPDRVIYHRREKRQGKEQHGVQDEQSLMVTVQENGLRFLVDLTKRIDTGLFLDQMVARQSLREVSAGLKVLNLFSYTGSFSVYAAAGGAEQVTSVDLSSTYTQWCEQNLAANGFSGGAYPCVSQDAAEYIRNAVKERRKFDIIVFDPPSFSNSRKMEHDFDVKRDYIYFIRLLNGLLVIGGKVLFSTNLSGFRFEKRKIHGYEIREITRDIAAPGFSVKKSSLRSWILEKKEDVQMPLDQEVTEKKPVAESAVEVAVEAIQPLMDVQDGTEKVESTLFEADEEDDVFVLDWDENDSPSPVDENLDDDKKNAKQRRYERRHPGETAAPVTPPEEKSEEQPRREDRSTDRDYRPRRTTDDQRRDDRGSGRAPRRFDNDRPRGDRPPRRYDNDRPRDDRPREDRPPRRFDNDRPRGDRPFDRDRPPRRFDNDRPRGDRPFDRDRPPRRFDNDRPRDDRPREDRPPRRFDNDRPRDDRPREDRPPRRFDNDRPRGDRPFDQDRPPRRFDNDRPRGDRPFDRDRPPRRFDNDRPRDDRPREDRPPRRFDNDRPRGDRPFDRDRPPRRFDNDRPRGERPFDRDRPPRRFDNDRPRGDRPFDRDRPPRRFDNDRPRGDRPFDRDRPPRRFDNDRPRDDRPREDRPPRRFDNDRPRGDRPFDRDRPPRRFDNDRPREERPPRRPDDDRGYGRDGQRERSGSRGAPKPYGYDRFKPTRERGGDRETFFRQDEEKKED